jgi:hypothetical protein
MSMAIIAANGIAFASSDDGRQFGRAAPLDAENLALSLLGEKPIGECRKQARELVQGWISRR